MDGDGSGRSNGAGNRRSEKKDAANGRNERPKNGDKESGGSAAGRSGEADAGLRIGAPADDGVSYAWSHGKKYHGGFKCNYCGLALMSGGVSKLKVHLAGVKGDTRPCDAVPANVRRAMLKAVSKMVMKKKAKERRTRAVEHDVLLRMTRGREHEGMFEDENEDVRRAIDESLMEYNYRERVEQRGGRYEHGGSSGGSGLGDGKRVIKGFDSDLARAKAPVQTRIDTIWSEKENKDNHTSAMKKEAPVGTTQPQARQKQVKFQDNHANVIKKDDVNHDVDTVASDFIKRKHMSWGLQKSTTMYPAS